MKMNPKRICLRRLWVKLKKYKNKEIVFKYAKSIVEKRKIACKDLILACQRFLNDLENKEYDFIPKDAEFVIQIIESTFCHQQGEKLDGTPLRGTPFLLEPFQKFIIYNLLSFIIKVRKIDVLKKRLFLSQEKI